MNRAGVRPLVSKPFATDRYLSGAARFAIANERDGDITLDRDWVFSVPKLDPSPAAPYVFYIWNSGVQKFVQVRLPGFASTDNGSVPLIQSEGNLVQALSPDPFN